MVVHPVYSHRVTTTNLLMIESQMEVSTMIAALGFIYLGMILMLGLVVKITHEDMKGGASAWA
jgi:hypothetical protein